MNIKKRIIRLIILVFVISAVVFSVVTIKNQNIAQKPLHNSSINTDRKKEAKVTFIELGSLKCIPCKMMQPIMEEIDDEYLDVKVVFYDVWTAAGEPYGKKYKIQAIPTQIFLDKNGEEYARHTGFFPKKDLVKILEQGLNK